MAQRIIIPGFRKIETSGGGEGGTSNYNDLTNKPFINNVPVVGNLNTVDLKLTDATLTEEGVPADAKAVGTKLEESVSELKSDLDNVLVTNIDAEFTINDNYIDKENGQIVADNSYESTDFIEIPALATGLKFDVTFKSPRSGEYNTF